MNSSYDQEVLAEYTRVKIYIVNTLFDVSENYRRYITRRSPQNARKFKGELLSLFIFSKPHLIHSKKITKEERDKLEELYLVINEPDIDKLDIVQAIKLYGLLNEVIEKAGITNISYKKVKEEETFRY